MRKTVPSPGAVRSSTRPSWAATSRGHDRQAQPGAAAAGRGCARRPRGRTARTPCAACSGGQPRAVVATSSTAVGPVGADADAHRRCRAGCGRRRCRPGWSPPAAAGPRRRARAPARGGTAARPVSGPGGPGPARAGRAARRRRACAGPSARGAAAGALPSSSRASSSRSSTSPASRVGLALDPAHRAVDVGASAAPPIRYSSAKPWMPDSGVRSSWLASATKRRIRASDPARAANARLDLRRASRSAQRTAGRPRCRRGQVGDPVRQVAAGDGGRGPLDPAQRAQPGAHREPAAVAEQHQHAAPMSSAVGAQPADRGVDAVQRGRHDDAAARGVPAGRRPATRRRRPGPPPRTVRPPGRHRRASSRGSAGRGSDSAAVDHAGDRAVLASR